MFAYTHAIFPVSYILTEDHDELAIKWKSDGGFYFFIGSSHVILESTKKDNYWLKWTKNCFVWKFDRIITVSKSKVFLLLLLMPLLTLLLLVAIPRATTVI